MIFGTLALVILTIIAVPMIFAVLFWGIEALVKWIAN